MKRYEIVMRKTTHRKDGNGMEDIRRVAKDMSKKDVLRIFRALKMAMGTFMQDVLYTRVGDCVMFAGYIDSKELPGTREYAIITYQYYEYEKRQKPVH